MCEWMSNPIVGTLIGIVISAIIAIGIYFKSRKKKKLKWVDFRSPFIAKNILKIEGLKITYKDQIVSDLILTRIILENSGNETIKREDIATMEPLKIIVKNPCNIMEFIDIEQTEKANNFKLELIDDNNIKIDFEYIEPKNKVIIPILHTRCEKNNFIVGGKIIGGKITHNIAEEMKYFVMFNDI